MNSSELVKWSTVIFALILILYHFKLCQMMIDVKSKIVFTQAASLNTINNKSKQKFTRKEIRLRHTKCVYNRKRVTGKVVANLSIENMETIEKRLAKTIYHGGSFSPTNCTSKQMIAIIIPFRDREDHLKIFLRHMHPYLQRQQLNYRIFVIEMDKNIKFNRAMLKNIGFIEAMKLRNYTCFVFHDVDLLPEDDRIPYSCANMPQHLSVAIDKFCYRLPYKDIFGGVFSLTPEHFRKTNGMSNMFFGWGGEDDDLHTRVLATNLRILRPPIAIARYAMIEHTEDKDKSPVRRCLLRSTKQRMFSDGLSNLKYSLIRREFRPLYTWVLVRVNETEQVESNSYLLQFYKNCCKNKM